MNGRKMYTIISEIGGGNNNNNNNSDHKMMMNEI